MAVDLNQSMLAHLLSNRWFNSFHAVDWKEDYERAIGLAAIGKGMIVRPPKFFSFFFFLLKEKNEDTILIPFPLKKMIMKEKFLSLPNQSVDD